MDAVSEPSISEWYKKFVIYYCVCTNEKVRGKFLFMKSRLEKLDKLFFASSPAWGLGDGLTSPHRKSQFVTKYYTEPWNWRPFVNTVIQSMDVADYTN
jgi:hypothetical protein